jgi:hypothetical protein
MSFFKAIAIWLMLMVTESLNGTIREFWLMPRLGKVQARRVAFITGTLLILAIATLMSSWLGISQTPQLLAVGVLWLILTVGFEAALGRWGFGYSWQRIIADYNLFQGGLMSIGLVVLILAPLIALATRQLIALDFLSY